MLITGRWKSITLIPAALSIALVASACGSGGDESAVQAEVPASAQAPSNEDAAAPTDEAAAAPTKEGVAAKSAKANSAPKTGTTAAKEVRDAATTEGSAKATQKKSSKAAGAAAETGGAATDNAARDTSVSAADKAAYDKANGATDMGVTRSSIKFGTVNMYGIALGNVFVAPHARGVRATFQSINDRGGVLGRRLDYVDCDSGPGEVSRTKACLKKLVAQDRIFAMITGVDWGTASIHDDLAQYKLPYVGAWAYSQTEWQDPYMFPTHMSMLNEALANAHWVKNVIKPKTYGLLCLTSPEMQLACNNVSKVLDASGSKLVKKADVAISETSMSSQVLAMRAANPDHIVHYVINPATIAKFVVESAQQNYWPPSGMSGNHLAAEVLGSIFGKHPTNRYWTNTTYKLWGPEFMATMNKYANIRGQSHHILQAGYVATNIAVLAMKAIGPNLTRERLVAQLSADRIWKSDAALDQRFSWRKSERGESGTATKGLGQNREFIYKYTSTNTVSNPDGSPSGFQPDDKQFVIQTHK